MTDTNDVPATAEEFRALVLARYDGLSRRLQQIARYVLDHPNEVALETLAVIAQRADVQPSAIVRFAKGFGFAGASQMQRLFRDGLLSENAALGYGERVRQFHETVNSKNEGIDVLAEFVEGNVLALHNMADSIAKADIARAVRMIADAETVHVAGFRRSFPVAAYLAYSLQQAGKRMQFIDGVAGLALGHGPSIGANDLLIAVSYHPYAEETVHLVDAAVERGARILSLSDSLLSPIAKSANLVLTVHESEVRSFRSLAASMCLAQALVIQFAFAIAGRTKDID
ncbi:MurR/RpiR family transcriptional regulator [Hephaestia sp. GCM10023244]|uniref:MurR/RpiR family transcriptional regulator n=1 Tax=unclassified Hephaestia TaxID=2631281 RepID=UPI0020776819|nr:MurR/RpiR family transcriptional regulator [Hephaestia sp. MAHUQ-44]MCM8731529.1 MurR/RpiR family transcriptional regulator [Hephaestia sp. MAHUQ-44]